MNATTERETSTVEYRLTAIDRCDSCGAQAYIAAEVNGSELLFCAHHGRKYEEKLRSIATSWHDETSRLVDAVRRSLPTDELFSLRSPVAPLR